VQPNGLLADGSGEAYAPTGDPAVDAALAAAFGEPQAQGGVVMPPPPRSDPVLDALLSILSGQ
jgi:hypothetical protein